MRITSKGQVTIPVEVREKLGLQPNSEVEFVLEGNAVRIQKSDKNAARGRSVVDRLRRAGKGIRPLSAMTTDQIMALTRGAPPARRRHGRHPRR